MLLSWIYDNFCGGYNLKFLFTWLRYSQETDLSLLILACQFAKNEIANIGTNGTNALGVAHDYHAAEGAGLLNFLRAAHKE